MSNWKLFALVAVAIMLMSVLPGCTTENGGNNNNTKKTITIWHTFPENSKEKEIFEKSIEAYKASHPKVNIKVEAQVYDSAIDKFTVHAKAGDAPDIVRIPNDRLGGVADMGYLEDLTPYMTPSHQQTYVSFTVTAMKYKNKLYGLPASYDCMALLYNKNMFDLAGVPYPTENMSVEEFVSIAKRLTNTLQSGFNMPVTDPYWWFPWQYGFGGYVFDENMKLGINTKGSVDAVNFTINRLVKTEKIIPDGVDKTKMEDNFKKNKAAMVVDGPWMMSDYQDAEINVGIVSLPKVNETGKRVAPQVGVKGYSMYSGSKCKVEAFELMKYLTSLEVVLEFAKNASTIPAVKAAFNDPAVKANKIIAGFNAQADIAGGKAQLMPTAPQMSAVWGPVTSALESINTGADPATKLAEAQTTIEKQING